MYQALSVILSLLFIVIALAMILIVLIQKPQGGGLAGAFGGGMASQTAFGAKTGDALTVGTVTIFILFLVTSAGLVVVNRQVFLGGRAAPSAPSALMVTALSPTEIQLTWSDNSDNEEQFIIERSADGRTFETLTMTPPDTEEYVDTGLTPETAYWYQVRAANAAGQSPPTMAHSAVTHPLPRDEPPGEADPEGIEAPSDPPAAGPGSDDDPTPAEPEPDPVADQPDVGGGER